MTEEWRPVLGFEGAYEVSSRGNVRGVDRTLTDGRRWLGKALRPKATQDGHQAVLLSKGGRHGRFVHRIVLEAFVGPCPDGREGCHNDGNGLNNRLENLRWDTRSGNHADKHSHGTALVGERNHLAKLTAKDVAEMRAARSAGAKLKPLAARYGVTVANVSSIVTGKTWKEPEPC